MRRQPSRLHAALLLCLAPLVPIVLQLAHLQTVRSDALSKRVARSTERARLEIVPRGRILDRHGRILAQSVPAWSSFLDMKVLAREPRKQKRKIASIAKALSLDPAALRARMETKRRTIWLKRKMTLDELKALKGLKLASVGIQADERRYYPNESLARPVLGFVRASDGRGLAGLERKFDGSLTGQAVEVALTRDGAGRAILGTDEAERRPPGDLVLSIDRTVQYFAERALDDGIRKAKAKSGIAIVQDPRNGEILALAELPSDPKRSAAVQDVYEPGSTFKVVTAAAALEESAATDSDRIDCENGLWEMSPGVRIKDHEKKRLLSLREIIQYSSNIGTAKLGLKLGAERFLEYCRRFGFGYKTGIPLPGESRGLVPKAKGMREVRLANAAFGQGIAVTALQLVSAYSAIANGGTLMEPRLVIRAQRRESRGAVTIRRIASASTVAKLRDMLELVVEDGTGLTAAVPGYSAAGKTGTAEKIDPETGEYSTTDYVASFAGYVPASEPRFTILVIVDTPRVGEYGSEVAAPVFSQIARQLLAHFAIPPERALPLRWDAPEEQKKAPQRRTRPRPRPSNPLPASRPLPKPSFLQPAKAGLSDAGKAA
jgi:cell division protein FtsI (penicillin-binding protein 3)